MLIKDSEAKETPKKPVLGKAVIALPENYDPNRPKQHTTSKTKDSKGTKETRWTDTRSGTSKLDDKGDSKGETNKSAGPRF